MTPVTADADAVTPVTAAALDADADAVTPVTSEALIADARRADSDAVTLVTAAGALGGGSAIHIGLAPAANVGCLEAPGAHTGLPVATVALVPAVAAWHLTVAIHSGLELDLVGGVNLEELGGAVLARGVAAFAGVLAASSAAATGRQTVTLVAAPVAAFAGVLATSSAATAIVTTVAALVAAFARVFGASSAAPIVTLAVALVAAFAGALAASSAAATVTPVAALAPASGSC